MDASDSAPCASLLYVSRLAVDSSARDVATITRVSRVNNQRDHVTGLLVFDGESFAQLVQGPAASIDALFGRLSRDPRHRAIQILHRGHCAANGHQFADWQLGFLTFDHRRDGLTELRSLRALRGGAALAALLDLVPSLELLSRAQAGGRHIDPGSAPGY